MLLYLQLFNDANGNLSPKKKRTRTPFFFFFQFSLAMARINQWQEARG